ncbi:alpha/beta fold hydrolase [Novosphingobium sp. TH158]|uniref:alpha/beta fold hydrolase n=1 Tax=Novosphingobium sp. TH158 TaxID=2067455 RepID=UPI000C7D0E34|nr:alpha/beta fold hydrolase [Novosphingobium sp. TH158]PLK27522.1 alpha/beta hydrolase [Novosphingobium sp. TH158]
MATFVLVHGGGHGGWCWQPVADLLRARGHAVHAPTLVGVAERAAELRPGIDLETHIAEVAALLASLAPERVVLAGHSYGGLVITGAADRAPERVARLAYVDAPLPRDGEALFDISPGLAVLAEDVVEVDGVPLGLWPDERALAIYGLTGALAESALARLTPHPWACFTKPLRLTGAEALARIPTAMLNCAGTMAHRPEKFRQRLLAGDLVETIDAPHDVMLTHPQAVADFLDRLAAD